jgi:hypothetical protein
MSMADISALKKGNMEHNRILELAINDLERQKAAISAEIETIRSQLKGSASRAAKKAKAVGAPTGRISRKTRPKTEAEKKALSLKMKQVWKKRKAEAAKKKR